MTCRHNSLADPSCSTHKAALANLERDHKKYIRGGAENDASDFEIEEVTPVGPHIVLKVKYPSCKSCSFEGLKVMVFFNTTLLDVIKWRKIDPHFRNGLPHLREAPSPAARFPADAAGWQDALDYAEIKTRPVDAVHLVKQT